MQTTAISRYTASDNDLILDETDNSYVLRVRDLPDTEKPREKLLHLGPRELSIPELVAIVWGVGTRKEEVLAMAKRTIKEYGEKTLAGEPNPERLAESAHIPLTKACQIVASFELGRRFHAERGGRPVFIRTGKQAFHYLKDMGSLSKEQLRGLYLNSRYQIIHEETISIGSLTSNVVHPREVFQPAIENGAVAVIIAHNHPSGSLKPSSADIAITGQLKAAGKILGIDLLDHLIIAKDTYVSISKE